MDDGQPARPGRRSRVTQDGGRNGVTDGGFAPTATANGTLERIAGTARQQAKELAVTALRDLPGVGKLVDKPRTQPLRSSHIRLGRWAKAKFGSPEKPAHLSEIPWDYVRENEEKIPFLGLREHWYPALKSRELHNNEPKPVTMLGDSIVFFRDGNGKARALENRCPHRGPLLSLGQVGITEPGTITCRYHGMTFDGDGECVAFLADGPDSPACGKVRTRSYPTEELAGIVWVYMGEKDPDSVMDSVPHAKEVFAEDSFLIHRIEYPFSYLGALDNDIDLIHPSVLHYTCLLFSDQKSYGRVKARETECGGLQAVFVDDRPHAGAMHIDRIEWHVPCFAYHHPGDLDLGFGYNWQVPRDVGSCATWLIIARAEKNRFKRTLMQPVEELLLGRYFWWPGSIQSCIDGGDVAMIAAQGRVPRWDRDDLSRTDGPVVKARRMLMRAYAEERAEREARAAQPRSSNGRSRPGAGAVERMGRAGERRARSGGEGRRSGAPLSAASATDPPQTP
jgi:phenylpropionate dioxygenase-like ring-hydroxylating dioxygenase large terminal subunit